MSVGCVPRNSPPVSMMGKSSYRVSGAREEVLVAHILDMISSQPHQLPSGINSPQHVQPRSKTLLSISQKRSKNPNEDLGRLGHPAKSLRPLIHHLPQVHGAACSCRSCAASSLTTRGPFRIHITFV
jgi:hypothetical protein